MAVTVRPAPPEHYDWIAKRAELIVGPAFMAMEAINDRGEIVGMVGYDGWTQNSVCMHVALAHPAAARHLLRPCFGLAFDPPDVFPPGLGKRLVMSIVLSTNTRALALDRHLGFRETYRLKDWWADGVDGVVMEMRREDCRWVAQPALRKVG